MKTQNFMIIAILASGFLGFQGTTNAQSVAEGNEKAEYRRHESREMEETKIPNLSDEQKSKIKTLELAQFKEVLPLQNHVEELEAKQQTLTTMEKPDLAAINANIDEITKTQNQIMKLHAHYHQDIRALLNDEQRMFFDMQTKNSKHTQMNNSSRHDGDTHVERHNQVPENKIEFRFY